MTRTLLSEAQGYALLEKYGIPVPRYAIVQTAAEAEKKAEEIGFPLVAKIVSSDVIHKSDAGGVITGIASAEEAGEAFRSIMGNVKAAYPEAGIQGVILEEQQKAGLELIVGGKTDPAFGKVLSVGMGGTLVELLRDISLRLLPASDETVRAMVRSLRGYPLLAGYRGAGPKDEEAFCAIIGALGRMFLEHAEIAEFDINPVILYGKGACAVDARIYVSDLPLPARQDTGDVAPPGNLFRIGSVAVVGASQNPDKVGYAICRNMLAFPGALYPVNPGSADILGKTAYPSLSAIPDRVDAVVIAIPAAGVPAIVEEAGKKKIPLAVIVSSGFREIGPAGKVLEDQVLAAARKYGIRVMGPNCLGFMLPAQGINTTFDPVSPRAGSIAFVSQSGAIITTIVDWSLPEEIGFSAVISVGNQLDLTFEDFVAWTGSDPATNAIILYVEEIRDGRRFLDVVSRITPTKPVIVIKSGSSEIGQKAASSHTGSLAGSAGVYLAAFREAGMIPVRSIREAFQAAELLASEGYPSGTRAVVISNAGGFAVLSSDYAERFGIDLVHFPDELVRELDAVLPPAWNRANPMDMVGDSHPEQYAKTFDILIRHQDLWDIAFVIAVPTAISNPIRVANELIRFSTHTKKMIVGCMIGGDSMKTPQRILRESKIPNFPDLEDAFRAVGNICRYTCRSADGHPGCRKGSRD
ncbi:CoA-binding domain protein [Methanoregula boonei 6A8]|jgi:acetyl coenzyme A synthetase (ADP forming)-like protein|uniref:acetate--CoA ligase (ADP-forming) n=1 Tax=Methanoregula boonei (strain DSM 21154 / JCM 14090 / 6A8) TaxID=456442 RepID=A7I8S6_METB6|nr:acetate--CoA ligase family protein [Methanoregula boonei]ABS56137.1 CoA-binding domain protein [Methanoregula boonei 6A8]